MATVTNLLPLPTVSQGPSSFVTPRMLLSLSTYRMCVCMHACKCVMPGVELKFKGPLMGVYWSISMACHDGLAAVHMRASPLAKVRQRAKPQWTEDLRA